MGKYQKIVLGTVAILAISIGVFNFVNSRWGVGDSGINRINPSGEPTKPFETKTDTQAGVTVEVTPEKLGWEEENVFLVSFNTHTVGLDFDFQQLIVLKDDLGNEYQAVGWTGGRGGHHLSGRIIFPKVKKGVKMMTLIISQVGGVERTFSFKV